MTRFTITSFNARWGLATDDVPYDLLGVLERFDTDVIALQEVWDPADAPGTIRRGVEALGYQVVEAPLSGSTLDPTPQITADPAAARGTWGVMLLSRLPIERTRLVDLGRLVERWDVAHRDAVLADVRVGEHVVSMTCLHLSFALPNALAQLRRVAGYLPTDRPSLLAGDCNLWGPLATTLVGRHERAVRGRTWPAHRPHSQLDHVLVSPELEVVSSSVGLPCGSDHRPVHAHLRVRDPR